ncbi:hypothetical protein R9X47_04415 [Wukongibacter baidiensis]|uniref:hypothetical protein n=1 Tax=Wukongibacter baidiensis TaxID=1723361 RepID=UPI003D7FA45C
MKSFFRPFNAESLLVALGLTFITYMVTPIAKELFRQVTADDKKIYGINKGDDKKFVMGKESL